MAISCTGSWPHHRHDATGSQRQQQSLSPQQQRQQQQLNTPLRPFRDSSMLLSPGSAVKTTRMMAELMQSPHMARRRRLHMQPKAAGPPPPPRSPFAPVQPQSLTAGLPGRREPQDVLRQSMEALRRGMAADASGCVGPPREHRGGDRLPAAV